MILAETQKNTITNGDFSHEDIYLIIWSKNRITDDENAGVISCNTELISSRVSRIALAWESQSVHLNLHKNLLTLSSTLYTSETITGRTIKCTYNLICPPLVHSREEHYRPSSTMQISI
jgi:hypothetical protein